MDNPRLLIIRGDSPFGKIMISSSWAILPLLSLTLLPVHAQEAQDAFAEPRKRMVESDLRRRGIKDLRVLEVMSRVPRHLFVPKKQRLQAYQDRSLPIGDQQTISQPYVVALMTELLKLKGNERILEVGTGSGYQAAVLSLLVKEVYTIEIIPSLAESAQERLQRLGYSNVVVKSGDGFFGWEEKGPFDGIVVTAATKKIPQPLWSQLREGGRLVMPLGESPKPQKLIRVTKIGGEPRVETITGVIFVPMTGKDQEGTP